MSPFISDIDDSKFDQPLPARFHADVLKIIWKDPKKRQTYRPEDIANGNLFRDMMDHDPLAATTLQQLHKFYLDDPVLNPFTLWERPPIKMVVCAYGVGLETP